MLEVIFWQPTLTEHQIHILRSLNTYSDMKIRVIIASNEFEFRKKEGWIVPDYSDIETITLGNKSKWRRSLSLLKANRNAIHIFSSLWADRVYFLLICLASVLNVKIGLIVESYSDIGFAYHSNLSEIKSRLYVHLRPLVYRMAGLILGRSVNALFAISNKAVHQFIRAGFKKEAIYQFGYFIPKLDLTSEKEFKHQKSLRLVYIGSLIKRKGVDLLIEAGKKALELGAKLEIDIYGVGDDNVFAECPPQIRYRGVIPFGNAQRVLAEYDAVIVPSRYDGWSVVVNEAILQGIPVFVSKQTGASLLIEVSKAGAIYDALNTSELASMLLDVSKKPDRLLTMRLAASKYYHKILPDIAGHYMRASLYAAFRDGERPPVPWLLRD